MRRGDWVWPEMGAKPNAKPPAKRVAKNRSMLQFTAYFRRMNPLHIGTGHLVRLTYVLRETGPEGEELEVCTQEDPFEFVFGGDEVLPAFEEVLMGKTSGDTFQIALKCEDAYGEEDEEAYVEVPKEAFLVDGEVDESVFEEGEVVPMETEDGETLIGVVAEVKLNSVVVDFNHPFAGLDLYFEGKVESVEVAPASN